MENDKICLRGGSEESSAVPFCGPNPKDEFDSSDYTAEGRPASDTVHVPQDVNSVPEAVEVHFASQIGMLSKCNKFISRKLAELLSDIWECRHLAQMDWSSLK